MARLTMIYMVLIEIGLLCLCSNAVLVHELSRFAWDGVEFFISVKRDAIQKKLDAFRSSVSSESGDGPKLFIPKEPVLPGFHQRDHHPIFLDVGYLSPYEFEESLGDNLHPCVSTSGLEAAVTIPLLAGSPTGRPVYALALAKFYEKSRGDIFKTNVIYPYLPVDEIQLTEYGAVVRNGSDELRLSFNRRNDSCKPQTSIVKEEFKEFVLGDFQFGLPAPDFSLCDRPSFQSEFCAKAEGIKCDVHRNVPNVCQIWQANKSDDCVTTLKVENITSGFREFILLNDEPINVLASERYKFNGSVGLKFPCQE